MHDIQIITMCILIHSGRSRRQSLVSYRQSAYYTNVPFCCPGYDGNIPTCQGKVTAVQLINVS